jgi:hypothetical protein
MDEIKNLLDEQIKTEIEGLSSLKTGSDEKSKAVTDLTKLYQSRIDEMKAETSLLEHQDRHELERDKHFLEEQTRDDERRLKEAEHKSRNLDRWVNVGLQVGLTVLSIISYDIWNRRGLKFEEEGTITSSHTRNLISRMLPSFKK